jgi:hypothetical protein
MTGKTKGISHRAHRGHRERTRMKNKIFSLIFSILNSFSENSVISVAGKWFFLRDLCDLCGKKGSFGGFGD